MHDHCACVCCSINNAIKRFGQLSTQSPVYNQNSLKEESIPASIELDKVHAFCRASPDISLAIVLYIVASGKGEPSAKRHTTIQPVSLKSTGLGKQKRQHMRIGSTIFRFPIVNISGNGSSCHCLIFMGGGRAWPDYSIKPSPDLGAAFLVAFHIGHYTGHSFYPVHLLEKFTLGKVTPLPPPHSKAR